MLTATAIRQSKPQAKAQKLRDGGGLYLLIPALPADKATPSKNAVSRWWRLDYRHAGKRKTLSLGTFPEVSLAQARQRREEARAQIAQGIDPSAARKAAADAQEAASANSFGAVAAEWHERQRKGVAEKTRKKDAWLATLTAPLNPVPVADITPPQVLALVRKIEADGFNETAHRVRSRIGQIIRYAIATGRAERDPTADLRGALAPIEVKSHAAITEPKAIGQLLRDLDAYTGQPSTTAALRLAPLLFVRPGELRHAEWSEIDLDAGEWRIPADKTKMRNAHIVPLPSQAVAILRELKELTGNGGYVFPGIGKAAIISDGTMNAALRRMGYDRDVMVSHGFRAMASSTLNEMGWSPDVIERQLAHVERNKVRAVYNRAQYLPERREMMQAWADHLDGLKAGGDVVPFRRATA